MASPISIGDAILLAQIAHRVGHAFSSGRKSAPAEFEEVQKLLYTLSEALGIVAKEFLEKGQVEATNRRENNEILLGGGGRGSAVLSELVSNCRDVLEHLEALVEKYSDIGLKTAKDENSESRRWRDDLQRTWKRVKWTKEGGGLDALKKTLTVHITGLNLALAALNRQQSGTVLNRIESIDARLVKLDLIYDWFVTNLQSQKVASATAKSFETPISRRGAGSSLRFHVWVQWPDGVDPTRCCPQASFSEDWLAVLKGERPGRLFRCFCDHTCHLDAKGCTASCPGTDVHHNSLNFSLLPSSILVRVADPDHGREWRIFVKKAGVIQPVLLRITHIEPASMADFEAYANRLAACQTALHMSQGCNTSLISFSTEESIASASVLNMEGLITSMSDKLNSASLLSGGRCFKLESIQSVQLLHYRSISADMISAASADDAAEHLLDNGHADLILTCRSASSFSNEVLYIARIEARTIMTRRARLVQLNEVWCVEEDTCSMEEQKKIKCSMMELEFGGEDAAEYAIHVLHSMQQELRISSFRNRRWGERVVLEKNDIGDVQIQEFQLTSTHLSIIFTPVVKMYRLILMSSCHSLSVCLELSEEFVMALAAAKASHGKVGAQVGRSSEAMAWFVEIAMDGTEVSRRSITVHPFLEKDPDIHRVLVGSNVASIGSGMDN